MYMRCPLGVIYNNIRCISTSVCTNASNHYDVLGVTPKATQGEIKSAYYKLSKVYHPDKNQGSVDAANKFRDITSAYEILGNVRTRRLYDKGVHVDGPTVRHPAHDDDPRTKFYRSREHRQRPTGRTPIYDFDEWSRMHYGATFARDMERKRRNEMHVERKLKVESEIRSERTVMVFLVFVFMLMWFANADYDKPNYNLRKESDYKPMR